MTALAIQLDGVYWTVSTSNVYNIVFVNVTS